jgi:diphosphomevalonate decarboxylase
MSSVPGYILIKPATISVLEKLHEFKSWSGVRLGFTMDAGPNIHLIYFERDYQQVKQFIEQELTPLCINRRWIDDSIGNGPSAI